MSKIIKYLLILFVVSLFILIGINYYVVNVNKNRIINSYDDIDDVDCILILGAGVRDDRPSLMLEDRLLKGIKLYKDGVSNKILMSGDHGNYNYDEVNIMKKYAISNGVLSSDIFMDHAGFSTYDSMYRLREIFGVKKVIIVTQEYHMYRALYIARSLGIDAYGVIADKKSYVGDDFREFREILARIKDFIKCIYKPKSIYLGDKISINGNGDVTND